MLESSAQFFGWINIQTGVKMCNLLKYVIHYWDNKK